METPTAIAGLLRQEQAFFSLLAIPPGGTHETTGDS